MGYDVTLLRGNVVISAERHDAALQAVRGLDARDELKSGWSQADPMATSQQANTIGRSQTHATWRRRKRWWRC